MCQIKTTFLHGGHAEISCEASGLPITHSNEYGMFCDEECGLEEMKSQTINPIEDWCKLAGVELEEYEAIKRRD